MASSMLTAEATALASAEANVNEALNTKIHSCANDPDFAVICDFLQKFSKDLGLELPNFKQLLDWLSKTDEVSPQLREMQIKLLRKTRKTVHEKSWESALSKFCFTYSAQDAWEIERFGYKNASAKIKLRILRELLECQFERNNKFRTKILTLSADSLRSQPIGLDRLGHAYWVTQDNDCNLRIYQEHLDEEIWQVVATNREEFVNLIKSLRRSEVVLPSADIGIVDEDTCSSSRNTYSETPQISPLPKEPEDSQQEKQKVPKLSIKINHGRLSKEGSRKDVGKGEEELAAEEDAKIIKNMLNFAEATECDDEEFEEAEEEYEDESDDDDDIIEDDDEEKFTSVETELRKDTKMLDGTKKVKPLLISQSKIVNLAKCEPKFDVHVAKKRTLCQMGRTSPTLDDNEQINLIKKSRPSLLDSKRSKKLSKYVESNECGEEDYEETADEDDNVDEEMEEEDIDSVAAEEDENEEKLFDDFEDDEENEYEAGEEISESVLHVVGEGTGNECEVGNCFLNYELEVDETIVSNVIEEAIFYVRGEGYGKECLVGNNKGESDTTKTIKSPAGTEENSSLKTQGDKSNLYFGEPGCLKVSGSNKDDSEENFKTSKLSENLKHKNIKVPENIESLENTYTTQLDTNAKMNEINGENRHKDSKSQTLAEKFLEPLKTDTSQPKNIDNTNLPYDKKDKKMPKQHENLSRLKPPSITSCSETEQIHASKMSVLESLKKELRESKQKSIQKCTSSAGERNKTNLLSSVVLNRKRRIDNTTAQQITNMRNSNSESEIDLNSEYQEDLPNDQEPDIDELDVGGKRLKMRAKQTNSEFRKKIEAQKVAANEENTSSSGGEEESRGKKKGIVTKKDTNQTFKLEETRIKVESTKPGMCTDTSSRKDPLPPPVRVLTQNTLGKKKPTLTEIIEKKLKKTSEKDETKLVSTSAVETDAVRSKGVFSPSNKSSITNPLKKNFIRKDESSVDALPRKRTTSENSISSESTGLKVPGDKKTSQNNSDNQQNSPERQRKRRSSEDTTKDDVHEKPEPKMEVNCEGSKESITKKDTNIVIKDEIYGGKKELNIKEESTTEYLTPSAGRRSGRREGLTIAIVETSQPKRTRGFIKKSTKKPMPNIANCVEDIKEIKEENKDCKTAEVALDVKEKNEEVKYSNNDPEKNTNATELNKNQIPKCITSPVKGFRKQRDVDATNIIQATDNETPVRQSRRIAQQKIREEAERRKLEEIALRTMKQELKKKKKAEKQSDPTVVPPSEPSSESEESDVETKRKIQKKKCPGKNGSWSSGSEEQEDPDEEDEEPPHYEIDPGSPLFKSDHEFSPESDIEDESQVVPMKRARTARKEDAADDEPDEEEACQKCNKSDHPEWILLCDNCDKGYHCSCLLPVLFYIPEGEWYCPPCQQEQLIKALESHLKQFDDLVEHKRNEEEKEKILAEEEKARQEEEIRNNKHNKSQKKNAKINNDDSTGKDVSHSSQEDEDSDESVNRERKKSFAKNKKTNRCKNLKNNDKRNHRDWRQNSTRNARNRSYKRGSDSDSNSRFNSKRVSKSNSTSTSTSSSSSSYSESDNEPIYKLRKRRQINVSYRLNEYDDLINSALKKEMDEAAGAGNLGRGKDISTIIEADKEEKARQKQLDEVEPTNDELSKPKSEEDNCKEMEKNTVEIKVKNSEQKRESIDDDSDEEPINQKFNVKPSQKKKSRKLTTLDISSEDDDGSDEDFKGSSLDDDDEDDTSISASNSDSSLEIYKRHGKSRKKRRKAARKAFRERRKDRKFVVDESDDEEVQRPKSKKKRKDDSDYTESEADDDDNSELSENIDSADLCDDTTSDESDGAWRPNNSKKAKKSSVCSAQKTQKPKKLEIKKPKKIEYSDDDVSETEDENDDESGGVGGGKEMGGKQPRSQPLKTSNTATKTKLKGKGCISTKIKKKKRSSEDELSESDSEDSTRRTRGRRYAYMEDFDDESSDGGIKPGVQRPDTPPEEREKFIKRQEEIKRMLAEKNAEGAKLVATPRLTPIKTESEKDKRSPVKASGDSLSTVPLSVIRQAKVLDIDYLQRRGEHLDDLSTDVGEVDDDFDDTDLPDDLPEDMDEDTIARMVEEEEEFGAAAARDLPAPDEVLRVPPSIKPKIKDVDKSIVCTNTALFPPHLPQTPVTVPPTSGLQEPIRKRLPMPTMHPPLLRHQFLLHDAIASAHLMQRHSGPPTSHLLQSALSAPLTQPLDRNYPSTSTTQTQHLLINRLTHSMPLQATVPHMMGTPRTSLSSPSKSTTLIDLSGQEKTNNTRIETEMKPRGRRKKITPLRDTLQKQQAAAAVTAATATNSILASASVNTKESISVSVPSSVIKGGPPTKGRHMETSVITSVPPSMPPVSIRPVVTMPSVSGIYSRSDGQRFYDSLGSRPGIQRHRGPPNIPHSLLQPHPAIRSSYGPPPPLKGSSSIAANSSTSSAPGSIRHHVPPYVGMPPNARHSSPHLNMYRQPIYGNPSFGPRANLRPNIHTSEYTTGSRTYSPYGFYPPPPPLTTPGQGPTSSLMPKIQPPISQHSTSVIVSATAAASSKSTIIPSGPSSSVLCEHSSKSSTAAQVLSIKVNPSSHLPQRSKVVTEPRKKLTTLQSYSAATPAKKSPLPPAGESSGLSSPGLQSEVVDDSSSTPSLPDNSSKIEPTRIEGHASEFSGLVSYFSSQHDDYNT